MADYLNGPRCQNSTCAVLSASATDFTIATNFRPCSIWFKNTGSNPAYISFLTTAVITDAAACITVPAGDQITINVSSQNIGDGVTDYKISAISAVGNTTLLVNAIGDR